RGKRVDRREFLKKTAVAGAGLTIPTWIEATPSSASPGAACRWGAYASPRNGETAKHAILALENKIGRKLAITRHYMNWDRPIPGEFAHWSAAGGRKPYVSWQAVRHNGIVIPWHSIATGNHDREIRAQAARIRSWGRPAYFNFHHEPENDLRNGGPADFRAAFQRVRNIFDSMNVHNLTWVVILMASTYAGGHGGPGHWLPSRFELVGVDGYNRWPCLPNRSQHHWASFREVFRPAHRVAVNRHKGMFVGEFGSVERNACGNHGAPRHAKARWLHWAGETLKGWPEVKGVIYSHTHASYQGYNEAYWVNTSASSLSSFRRVGHLDHFH
ncbi:MAG: twin-arginine translocation signal domain-containing protein, partial [Actinomycetota bacterium]|nr:twin-arginine translocation signal domain-containing protein [Actinomycetota bacterium]